MTRQEAEKLIAKYTEGNVTPEEKQLVEYHFNKHLTNSDILLNNSLLKKDNKEIWRSLAVHIAGTKPRPYRLWIRMAGVAAVIAIVLGVWFFSSDTGILKQIRNNVVVQDIPPGKNTATLMLDNGKTINLSGAQTGLVIDDSSLRYNDGSVLKVGRDSVQTLKAATPAGGTYQITLQDGTRVWLNAASYISAPSTFSGLKNREVEIVGEAYFEVAHNAKKPFRVKTRGQVIEVLGTKFNINAYEDELATRTTLLEGAVKVSTSGMAAPKTEVRLKPGQQTTLQNNLLTASDADMEEAFAWKNGYFMLNNESLESIMRKLSRWYDIEVEYRGKIPKRQFGGEISRNTNLLEVLKVLELAKVHFTVEGKKIIVTP